MSIRYCLLLLLCAIAVHAADFSDRVGRGAADFSFVTKDGPRQVKDFRGRWLLLQFGATWCSPSEASAELFSRIRRSVEGKPFEFVEIYSDPSLADVELFSFTNFSGIRGLADSAGVPGFYREKSIPAWFLINPSGVVEEAGGFAPLPELQRKVTAKLSADKNFQSVSWSASRQEELVEAALSLFVEGNDREASRTAWENVLTEDPDNARAITGKARALAWLKGYPAANRYLTEAAVRSSSDRVRIFAALYGLTEPSPLQAIDALRALGEKYPQGEYLESFNLLWTKLPEELTDPEARQMTLATQLSGGHEARYFLAYFAEVRGAIPMARTLFARDRREAPADRLAEAIFLNRQGDREGALKLLGRKGDEVIVERADPQQAWLGMLQAAAVQDWPQLNAFAVRYSEVRPDRLQGLIFQLWAAQKQGDSTRAAELTGKIRAFLQSSDRYAQVREKFETGLTQADLLKIPDVHVRFDLAAAGILLAQEQPEKAAESARQAQLGFLPSQWCLPLLREMARQP